MIGPGTIPLSAISHELGLNAMAETEVASDVLGRFNIMYSSSVARK